MKLNDEEEPNSSAKTTDDSALGKPRDAWWLPDPGTRLGAIFYAVYGGVVVWLVCEVLPHHLVIGWR
ncbi:hypothetical protein [Streptomyces sp. NBC_01190]|uniref:hypothetical protein n=1 Tax=Streptomyces sp. NBC_01190 TaxID=2903767 RepID=UPI00386F80AE|nr:hypothetical protein OG519_00055 [Streptomyces sp. NBC_01190]WSS24141.1 hypothetical protein OG519_33995 [Streptomyces sp. NBC_01190]